MLAEGKERQREILEQLQELCNHILDKCTNTEICSDVIGIKASADLLLGKPMEAIEGLSNLLNPKRILNQSDCMLIQAYLMNGESEKADSFTQASLYLHLLMVVEESTCLEELDLGTQMPRSKMLVIQSARESLKQPVFDGLRGRKEFARLEKMLMKF